jgi:hypothetical protein
MTADEAMEWVNKYVQVANRSEDRVMIALRDEVENLRNDIKYLETILNSKV